MVFVSKEDQGYQGHQHLGILGNLEEASKTSKSSKPLNFRAIEEEGLQHQAIFKAQAVQKSL